MPLLFKNGKLVVNDIDQLVFSDDPNSCRCCPGLCECPPGSLYAIPKYVDDLVTEWSNIPDTYEETVFYDVTRRTQAGGVSRNLLDSKVTINGLSALNGTWPGILTLFGGTTVCDPPDVVPACPYDDPRYGCRWKSRWPIVPITGTYYYKQFYDDRAVRPNIPVTAVEENYFINGYAVAALPPAYQANSDEYFFRTHRASILLWACLSTDVYGVNTVGEFSVQMLVDYGGLTVIAYNPDTPFLGEYRFDGCFLTKRFELVSGGGFFSALMSPLVFPNMLALLLVRIFGGGGCPYTTLLGNRDPHYVTEYNFLSCNAFANSSVSESYSLGACSGAGSFSGETDRFDIGHDGGTVRPYIAYDATYNYSTDAFAFDVTRTATILP